MTVSVITSSSVGSVLATGTDSHFVSLSLALPTSVADDRTPLTLVDANAAPTAATLGYGRAIYSATLGTLLSFLFGWKSGIAGTPGLTPPAWPMSLGPANMGNTFTKGIYVQSCPAGASFTLTTG